MNTMTESSLQIAALNQFGPSAFGGTFRHQRRAERERKAIKETASAFHRVVNSATPPATREEAIQSTVGTLGWVLSFLFPQYAIAIKVAAFLWDIWNSNTTN
jgi:hypothetical protein